MNNIQETRLEIYKRSKGRCEVCHRRFTDRGCTFQVAHRIKQKYADKYGKDVVHHPLNMAATCSLACNASVDLGVSKFGLMDELAEKIKYAIDSGV